MLDPTKLLASPRGRSLSAWARRRRSERFLARFPHLAEMRVVDLGGEVHTWLEMGVRPREVVLLNIPWQADLQQAEIERSGAGAWMSAVGGDACDPPPALAGEHFDLAYSNSVIEHVGGHGRREAFARSVRALAAHHWVQTPNRYFPVEPHWVFPGFQFLPARARLAVTRSWPIGHFAHARGRSERQQMADVLEIELLSAAEMRFYFPDSELVRERLGPLTKSLIMVRQIPL
jgi:hypothetical protein